MIGFVFASSGPKNFPNLPKFLKIQGFSVSCSKDEVIIRKEGYPTLEWWIVKDGIYVVAELTKDIMSFDIKSFDWKNTLRKLYDEFFKEREFLSKQLSINMDDVLLMYPFYSVSRAEMHDIIRIELGDKPNYDELVKEELKFFKESPKDFMSDFLKLLLFCYCASLHPKISKLGFDKFFNEGMKIFELWRNGEDVTKQVETFYREVLKKAMRI